MDDIINQTKKFGINIAEGTGSGIAIGTFAGSAIGGISKIGDTGQLMLDAAVKQGARGAAVGAVTCGATVIGIAACRTVHKARLRAEKYHQFCHAKYIVDCTAKGKTGNLQDFLCAPFGDVRD